MVTIPILVVVAIIALFLYSAIKILQEYERGVIFFLGRFWKVKGPGLIILIPMIQRMVKVSLRTIVLDIPPQDIITKDNVSINVNSVVYFRVIDPQRAIIDVEDFFYATSQLAQTTLRSVLGQSEFDELLTGRERINHELQQILDLQTNPWGIKVAAVEVKHLDLPLDMQRAMAKQAEAERERRAKIIHAEGELQAAQKLADAGTIVSAYPATIQLRFLQILTEVSVDKNTTIVVPLPIDLLTQFLDQDAGSKA